MGGGCEFLWDRCSGVSKANACSGLVCLLGEVLDLCEKRGGGGGGGGSVAPREAGQPLGAHLLDLSAIHSLHNLRLCHLHFPAADSDIIQLVVQSQIQVVNLECGGGP